VSVRVQIIEAARDERRDAVKFYRAESREAARAFERDFIAVVAVLRNRPLIGAPHLLDTRRKVFAHFPYSLIYRFKDDVITIYAVMHDRRDPGYWIDRVEQQRSG
jgi:plasmid stabilization system protein ParE